MNLSIGILCGGLSRRFRGKDKGLVLIKNVPMIKKMVDKLYNLSNDILIAIKNEKLINAYSSIFNENIKILVDIKKNFNNPIIGAYTCFKNSRNDYTFLLACDLPLIKVEVLQLLINQIHNHDAIIPRHPNGYIEPLHAIYHNKRSITAIEKVINSSENLKLKVFISKLDDVYYFPTDLIKKIDPDLEIFYNINTVEDLKKINNKFETI